MTISYQLGDKLYLNITNKCQCACTFCIRREGDGVGDGENLWLEREPSESEVVEDLKKRELKKYRELVFCGYGEPTECLDVMLGVCKWLKQTEPEIPVRLNTNGLAELSHGKAVAPLLEGLVDIVSISLNAPDAKRYQEVTRSKFGERAFDSMLSFAADCKRYVPEVVFSVVDVITPHEIEACEKLAAKMDIPLRVRGMI